MDKDYEIEKLLELYSLCTVKSNNEDMCLMESLPPEDERWLMEAIRSDFIDPVQKIKENITLIRGNLVNGTMDNKLTECIVAIKELQDLTENLDFAQDFVKLGGLNLIEDLLLDQNARIRCESFELLGNINQNNLFCQTESIDKNIIEKLVDKISQENDVFLLKKLLYALSCTIRGNPSAFERFLQTNGFDLMLNVLQTSLVSAIRCKIAFFIYCLCTEMDVTHIGYRRIELCMDSFINCLINLSSFSELETEHLLGSVCFLIKSYPSITLKRKYELMVFLKTQLQDLDHSPATEEVVFYTNEILTILYNRSLTISK